MKWSPTKHRKCAELTQKPAESKLCIGATEWKNSSLLAVNLVDLLAELDNIEQGDGIILVLPARNCDRKSSRSFQIQTSFPWKLKAKMYCTFAQPRFCAAASRTCVESRRWANRGRNAAVCALLCAPALVQENLPLISFLVPSLLKPCSPARIG